VGIYVNEEDIEDLLQIDLSSSSVPDSAAVARWVDDMEAEIQARGLGSHMATDVYLDVPSGIDSVSNFDWAYNARTGNLKFDMGRGSVIPLNNIKFPVIGVTTLYKNDADVSSAPSWEALTQWDGTSASTHYMLLNSGKKSLGYALWIYDEEPLPGPKRLKMTYLYGRNVASEILSMYCTYAIAVKILMARMGSNEPDGLSMLEGGDLGSFVNRQYTERIAQYRYEMLRIEAEHFPQDIELGMEVI